MNNTLFKLFFDTYFTKFSSYVSKRNPFIDDEADEDEESADEKDSGEDGENSSEEAEPLHLKLESSDDEEIGMMIKFYLNGFG